MPAPTKNTKGLAMTTAKIDRVAYIGWRGIAGCEVIDLDEELTGFIGAGGAGNPP